jgi:hypothetical protein
MPAKSASTIVARISSAPLSRKKIATIAELSMIKRRAFHIRESARAHS